MKGDSVHSGAYTSPFLDTDDLKMALRARKVSGAFEKRTHGAKGMILAKQYIGRFSTRRIMSVSQLLDLEEEENALDL